MSVLIETTEGNIVIDLWYREQELLCLNFVKLCQLNYYFFAPFHSLQKDLVVSIGNREYPEADPCYAINHFVDISPYGSAGDYLPVNVQLLTQLPKGDNNVGIVSFATTGDKQNPVVGSQFSICLSPSYSDVESLTTQIPFGKVAEGFAVLQLINGASVENGRLVEDIRITHIHVLYDPFTKVVIPKSILFSTDKPTPLQLKNMQLPAFEKEDTMTKSMEAIDYYELSLELLDKRADYRVKPSPKTLFIGKLNQITTSESLNTIFSRFGIVKSANVMHDKETHQSLRYGFVEFETQEEAENAYLKLHKGCIIDGRQVIVDFSQLSYKATKVS